MKSLRPLLITAALAVGLSVLVSACSDDDIITKDQGIPKDTTEDVYNPDQGSDGYDQGVGEAPLPDKGRVKPVIGTCVTAGSPGSYVSANCPRGKPEKPEGLNTIYRVVGSNFSGGWVILQSIGRHSTKSPFPSSGKLGDLYLTTELCTDDDGNGTLESNETNCSRRKVDDF